MKIFNHNSKAIKDAIIKKVKLSQYLNNRSKHKSIKTIYPNIVIKYTKDSLKSTKELNYNREEYLINI